MLDKKEFFIRKAIGWILRETAKTQPGGGLRVAGAATQSRAGSDAASVGQVPEA
jgi:DNA alkylation repair enzyme